MALSQLESDLINELKDYINEIAQFGILFNDEKECMEYGENESEYRAMPYVRMLQILDKNMTKLFNEFDEDFLIRAIGSRKAKTDRVLNDKLEEGFNNTASEIINMAKGLSDCSFSVSRWEESKDKIFPLFITSNAKFDTTMNGNINEEVEILVNQYNNDINFFYIYYDKPMIRYLSTSDLEIWGIEQDLVEKQAVINLQLLNNEVEQMDIQGHKSFTFVEDDLFVATRLMLKELNQSIYSKTKCGYVSIPKRGMALFIPKKSSKGILRTIALNTAKLFHEEEQRYKVSPYIYEIQKDGELLKVVI